MRILCRLAGRWGWIARSRPAAPTRPEVWCRPATLLALRDPRHAGTCLAGWH